MLALRVPVCVWVICNSMVTGSFEIDLTTYYLCTLMSRNLLVPYLNPTL